MWIGLGLAAIAYWVLRTRRETQVQEVAIAKDTGFMFPTEPETFDFTHAGAIANERANAIRLSEGLPMRLTVSATR